MRTNAGPLARSPKPGKDIFTLVRGRDCFSCGDYLHRGGKICFAKGKKCLACGQGNHLAKVCLVKGRARIRDQNSKARRVITSIDSENSDSEQGERSDGRDSVLRALGQGSKAGASKVMLDNVYINNSRVPMLYDPGASTTVISERIWKRIGAPKLRETGKLTAYTDVPVQTLGKTEVEVTAFDRTKKLSLYVIEKDDVPLFGLNWLLEFDLPLPKGARVCTVKQSYQTKGKAALVTEYQGRVKEVLRGMPGLTSEGVGTVHGHEAKIFIKEDVVPKICKVRPVPYALRGRVEEELDRLTQEGILEKVDVTREPVTWASPIVVVVKPTGKIRICADFKVTLNEYVLPEKHPLPTFDDIVTKLEGAKFFCVIDLKDAYLQIKVEEGNRHLLVITTHKGLFRYVRLPFGINTAPSLFQRIMDTITSGQEEVAGLLDDLIVSARTLDELLTRTTKLLQRISEVGMKIQEQKCQWFCEEVTYLGHRIDKEGVHPTQEHVEAIKNMPAPSNT